MMNAKASRLTSIALSACVILTAHWGKSIFEVKFLQFVCLFVTEATQYFVLGRVQTRKLVKRFIQKNFIKISNIAPGT